MTIEPGKDDEAPRRKFDDVASLFGTIVPAPGRPARSAPAFRPEPALPEPALRGSAAPPVLPEPLAADEMLQLPPALRDPQWQIEPRIGPRPRPTEIPWPDAFEPRPNFRKPQPRKWSWLLLIPTGIIVALGITLIDTRTLRSWVDANVLHRTPVAASTGGSLLPAPFRPGTPPSSVPDPAPEAPNPYPALPTSPVPVPPGAEVSPPPVDKTQPTVPPHITIQYRRNIPGAEGEARRLAALLQNSGGSIELRPNATTVRAPTITYYTVSDHEAATVLSIVLANEATNWIVRLGTGKYPPGSLDVWLP